ncbi:unnamed protein product [Toxocara canis]|uniref:Secreted protein n=1 Tax=Toxocara canis TaxID=6265 RepID=A0A183U3D3_TOXCA|nr:unnamed protein product [Toxocara canis]
MRFLLIAGILLLLLPYAMLRTYSVQWTPAFVTANNTERFTSMRREAISYATSHGYTIKSEDARTLPIAEGGIMPQEDHEGQLVLPSRMDRTGRIASNQEIRNNDCEDNCLSPLSFGTFVSLCVVCGLFAGAGIGLSIAWFGSDGGSTHNHKGPDKLSQLEPGASAKDSYVPNPETTRSSDITSEVSII